MPLLSGTLFKGSGALITGTFTLNAVATDPTTVQLTILKPDGTTVVVSGGTFSHSAGTGVYVYKYQPLPAVGTYYYQWSATFSTGDLATWEDNFTVSATPGATSEKF